MDKQLEQEAKEYFIRETGLKEETWDEGDHRDFLTVKSHYIAGATSSSTAKRVLELLKKEVEQTGGNWETYKQIHNL